MLLNRRLRKIKKAVTAWSKQNHQMWNRSRSLANLLERDFGCEYLGGGCYAHVFSLDEKTVLKVIKSYDSGYERFVKKARRSWSPFLPKIYYSGKWGTARVFILERLEQREDEETDALVTAIEFIAANGPVSRWLICPDEKLVNVVEYLKEDDCVNDIHAGNILWRGEQPVITDPCT